MLTVEAGKAQPSATESGTDHVVVNEADEKAAQKPVGDDEKNKKEKKVKKDKKEPPVSKKDPNVVNKEEHVEYHDQDGNLLDEEAVKSLEGKVEFQTKYETKTRVIDEDGNEIDSGSVEAEPVAPPHPDVEGVDRETVGAAADDAAAVAKDAAASRDGEKEAAHGQPKPASEGKEATGHEEL